MYLRSFPPSFPPSVQKFAHTDGFGSDSWVGGTQVYNKIDSIPLEEVDRMSRTPLSLTISCELSLKCVSAWPFLVSRPNADLFFATL